MYIHFSVQRISADISILSLMKAVTQVWRARVLPRLCPNELCEIREDHAFEVAGPVLLLFPELDELAHRLPRAGVRSKLRAQRARHARCREPHGRRSGAHSVRVPWG